MANPGRKPGVARRPLRDVLEEHDGPMLRWGLQKMEGERIVVPRATSNRPDPGYLEERYARFRAA